VAGAVISLNPNFEHGGLIDDLADGGVLHAECRRVFRRPVRCPTL
jgi:hypothetical protein